LPISGTFPVNPQFRKLLQNREFDHHLIPTSDPRTCIVCNFEKLQPIKLGFAKTYSFKSVCLLAHTAGIVASGANLLLSS
jgi:hypothetical protein